MPCGMIGDLPVGLSLVARHFDEESIIRATAAFSESIDWTKI
jgi:amidase